MAVSKESNFSFENDLTELINSYTSKRIGEIRLGEVLTKTWQDPNVKYVILGISESIGPQANYGRPGAEKAFNAFLNSFCNLQWNSSFSEHSIAFYGNVYSMTTFSSVSKAKELISELDQFIVELLSPIIYAGKIPIVIGGGHNNAYPLIKSLSSIFKKIAVINMDSHADCRSLEGRHSGNSFSYSIDEGLLQKYAVFGLHKAFLNQEITNYLEKEIISFEYFDNYTLGRKSFLYDINEFLNSLDSDMTLGVELDLDCIANFPSSAMNPIGFSISDARNYLLLCSNYSNVGYFHLTEAAVIESGDERIVGKTLAQMVYDILTQFRY